jgi:hypothetical protein
MGGRDDRPGDLILAAANANTASTFLFDSARKRMERGHLQILLSKLQL